MVIIAFRKKVTNILKKAIDRRTMLYAIIHNVVESAGVVQW